MSLEFLWLSCCVMIAYLSNALSGFGSNIIVLTLAAHLYPIETLLPVLVPLSLGGSIYITTKYRAHIHKTVLFQTIYPSMGIGFLLGILIFSMLRGETLKTVFGILVVLLSGREWMGLLRKKSDLNPISKTKSFLYIFSAGAIQGMYASGGPLLVYAVSKLNLQKSVFRSTLTSVWMTFNIFLTSFYYLTGKFTLDSFNTLLKLLPFLIVGTFAGEKLHTRVNEHHFKMIIFSLLLFAGLSLVV